MTEGALSSLGVGGGWRGNCEPGTGGLRGWRVAEGRKAEQDITWKTLDGSWRKLLSWAGQG